MMHEVTDSKIRGAFTGYAGGMLFQLANGQVWQQKRYKYKYRYAYRPAVRIYRESGVYYMEVECMDEPIEVVKVSALEEGPMTCPPTLSRVLCHRGPMPGS